MVMPGIRIIRGMHVCDPIHILDMRTDVTEPSRTTGSWRCGRDYKQAVREQGAALHAAPGPVH